MVVILFSLKQFFFFCFFFERIILCNSLVWTCEVTGRANLTFEEAVQCEKRARSQLKSVPKQLEKILLHLTTLTHRPRLNNLNDDIFGFVKDRYFIGETVEFQHNNERFVK